MLGIRSEVCGNRTEVTFLADESLWLFKETVHLLSVNFISRIRVNTILGVYINASNDNATLLVC